jgi:hypothetical protein
MPPKARELAMSIPLQSGDTRPHKGVTLQEREKKFYRTLVRVLTGSYPRDAIG